MGHHLAKITPARLVAWDIALDSSETRHCVNCDQSFHPRFGPSQINCSPECSAAWRKQKERKKNLKKQAVRTALARRVRRCQRCNGPIGRGNKYCRACAKEAAKEGQRYQPKPPHPCLDCGAIVTAKQKRCDACAKRRDRRKSQERIHKRYQTDPEFRVWFNAWRDAQRNRIRAAWLVAREMGIVSVRHEPRGRANRNTMWRQKEKAGLRYAVAIWRCGQCYSTAADWCRPKDPLPFPEIATVEWMPTIRRRQEHEKLAVLLAFQELGLTNDGVGNGRAA